MDNLTSRTIGGCWIWLGTTNKQGYGRIWIGPERYHSDLAHRVNYRRFKGEIPSDLVVRHKCQTPGCVNPDHLILGTVAENNNDRRIDRLSCGLNHGTWSAYNNDKCRCCLCKQAASDYLKGKRLKT